MAVLARSALALALLVAPLRAVAGPAAPASADPDAVDVPADDEAAVKQARDFWARGDWTKARKTLEPVAADPDRLQDPGTMERAMLVLADATISDRTTELEVRRKAASRYLTRIMDTDSDWRMPPDIYSPELYDLFVELQEERSRQIDTSCRADLMACKSDRATDAEAYRDLEKEHAKLQKDYAEQEVEVRTQVPRSRFLAAIPFGVGHFYNGSVEGPRARTDRALGATFLAAELAFGGAGLSLLLYRVLGDGCRRTKGFQRGSLSCDEDEEARPGILARRKAEETMGWFFWGTMVVDVVISQVRFVKFETTNVERVKRKDLDGKDLEPASKRPARRTRPRAKVRPSGALIPHGAGVGVRIEF